MLFVGICCFSKTSFLDQTNFIKLPYEIAFHKEKLLVETQVDTKYEVNVNYNQNFDFWILSIHRLFKCVVLTSWMTLNYQLVNVNLVSIIFRFGYKIRFNCKCRVFIEWKWSISNPTISLAFHILDWRIISR